MNSKMIKVLILLIINLQWGIAMAFTLSSPAFANNQSIPELYTCDGKDISPPLQWNNSPQGTQSFALVMEDPDAPAGTWDHWILLNIPGNLNEITEAAKNIPAQVLIGKNSWGKQRYNGPCPPSGTHRYIFKLLALDKTLDLKSGANKKELQTALQGHVLESAQLIGLYQRKK